LSKWLPSAILELFYHHIRPPTMSAAGRSCLSNFTSIWYTDLKIQLFEFFAYFAWNAYSGPKNGSFGGLWTPKSDYSSSRPPKGTSMCKSMSFKLSTVKICWGFWPVEELTESVMDTQTHTWKFTFCPCTALDRQQWQLSFRCFH